MCAHANLMQLRLITYTPFGPMLGCLACGTSWLVKDVDATSSSLALLGTTDPSKPTG